MTHIKPLIIALAFFTVTPFQLCAAIKNPSPDRVIFMWGSDINSKFVRYVADLTTKTDPRICFLPTASADNENNIKYWNAICKELGIESHILRVWVSSADSIKSFEETLLSMDAIVVGGGNTLNMIAIWKAQGIDRALSKALDRGIVLAGGSAGSICWAQNGISDSRPTQLSSVDGLGFLPISNCPHYQDSLRQVIYHKHILDGRMHTGYASDDLAGILFRNGKATQAVSINDINHSYLVTRKNGKIHREQLESKLLIAKDAIPDNQCIKQSVGKRVKEFKNESSQASPLEAFVSIKNYLAQGKLTLMSSVSSRHLQAKLAGITADITKNTSDQKRDLDCYIDCVLLYGDRLAGVVSKWPSFYGVWFFYLEDGRWLSAGEDIGGQTALEAQITFREKASMHATKAQQLP